MKYGHIVPVGNPLLWVLAGAIAYVWSLHYPLMQCADIDAGAMGRQGDSAEIKGCACRYQRQSGKGPCSKLCCRVTRKDGGNLKRPYNCPACSRCKCVGHARVRLATCLLFSLSLSPPLALAAICHLRVYPQLSSGTQLTNPLGSGLHFLLVPCVYLIEIFNVRVTGTNICDCKGAEEEEAKKAAFAANRAAHYNMAAALRGHGMAHIGTLSF